MPGYHIKVGSLPEAEAMPKKLKRPMPKTIAIIGSGVSGLAAIKSCLDEGLTPVCFERSDNIGGLWRYTDDVTEGQGCVMKSTIINTSKEIMTYSDFRIPAGFPVFMHHTKVHEYLKMYAEHRDMEKYIRFNTEVVTAKQTADFAQTGQWELESRYRKTGEITSQVYDGLMVCTGHHADRNIPDFQGMDQFRGRVMHTHEYRSHVGFEDKRVLVVGLGNSGSDVATELGRVAKQVYVSTRRGCWILNRIGPKGLPNDVMSKRRWQAFKNSLQSRAALNRKKEKMINQRFDHSLYGLQPRHHVDQQHPTGGDDLPNRIASGTVLIRPDIRRFTERGVEFVDGRVAEDIDVVIMATGYKFGFPFVQHPALEVKDNVVNLYKFVFPPDITPPTLAVIGCVQPGGAIMPLSELQCRWATRVFKGLVGLPKPKEMWREIHQGRRAMKARFVDSLRHTLECDYLGYMDDIARRIGCMPNISKLFWTDPKLARKCYFGTSAPYMYRLTGPGKWAGAREAMLTVMDRTLAGIDQGGSRRQEQGGKHVKELNQGSSKPSVSVSVNGKESHRENKGTVSVSVSEPQVHVNEAFTPELSVISNGDARSE